jgi:hypothetical protein
MGELDKSTTVALAEYREVVAQFRTLTDIRFKLLALLPVGTIATVILSKDPKDSAFLREPGIAAFALVATVCLATYNKRNDQHYDELVARAAELERGNLGLPRGSFAQRPTSWLKYGPLRVEHRWPVGLVYAATAALWAYLLACTAVGELSVPFRFSVMVKVLTPALIIACWLLLRKAEAGRRERLRSVVDSLHKDLDSPGEDRMQRVVCTIGKNATLLGCDAETARRRLEHHWTAYASKQNAETRSILLSAVIDLPARWIEDVWTGRR